jgi:hypothetical protein
VRSLDHGLATGQRIAPTPEDMEIAKRNIYRIIAWDNVLHPPGLTGEIVGSHLIGTLQRACGDYLHFKPKS